MTLHHIIFDLDGTLVDTLSDLTRAISDTLVAFGFPPVSRKETESYIGQGAKHFVKLALKDHADDPVFFQTFYDAYMIRYQAYQLEDSKPYPGIVDVLTRLRQEGKKLYVFSNKPHHITELLIDAVFPCMFDGVHGHKPNTKAKPDTTEYLKFAQIHQIASESSVFIGDSIYDVIMGKNLAMKTIALTYGYMEKEKLIESKPDVIVDHPTDIYPAIKKLEKIK
jgi:phosphoglycolate phosphatase